MRHAYGCRLDSKKQLQSSQGLLSSWRVQAAIAGYIQLVLPSGSSLVPPPLPHPYPLPTFSFSLCSRENSVWPYTSVGKGSCTEIHP